jgi:choice-of-anchor A domain-containing protein
MKRAMFMFGQSHVRSASSLSREVLHRSQRAGRQAGRIHPGMLLGLLAVATGCLQAKAGSTFLGPASNFNVYVSGPMTQNGGDAATSVAVGGNLTSTGFTIAGATMGSSLVVGGNLAYTNAEIQGGNAQVAGTVTMGANDNAALSSAATLDYGSATGNSFPAYPHFTSLYEQNGGISSSFFTNATATLIHDTTFLASQIANGTTNYQYGALTLTGTDKTVDYFNVSGANLAAANSLNISVPTGATAIVNVSGATDQFKNAGMNISGTTEDKVLFNFSQATSLTLSGVAFEGSILAPNATLYGSSGHTDGNVMVGGISATNYSFEYHATALFDGDPPSPSAVPEPGSIIMAGLGMACAGSFLLLRR